MFKITTNNNVAELTTTDQPNMMKWEKHVKFAHELSRFGDQFSVVRRQEQLVENHFGREDETFTKQNRKEEENKKDINAKEDHRNRIQIRKFIKSFFITRKLKRAEEWCVTSPGNCL